MAKLVKIGLLLVGLSAFVCLAYVLSYAPVYHIQMLTQNTVSPEGNWRHIYEPVEWLTDRTLLREPLLTWAGIWKVRRPIESESHLRQHP